MLRLLSGAGDFSSRGSCRPNHVPANRNARHSLHTATNHPAEHSMHRQGSAVR